MACIFHYAQVSYYKRAPTQAEQISMHYLFYAFCSNAFCCIQLYSFYRKVRDSLCTFATFPYYISNFLFAPFLLVSSTTL